MNGKNKLVLLLVLIAGVALGIMVSQLFFAESDSDHQAGIAEAGEHTEHGEEGDAHGEEIVKLDETEIAEFGLELATAGQGDIHRHVDLTGEIKIDPDRLAHIVPRFPGVVKDVCKKIGDPVKKGEVIAIIESNESLSQYEVRSLIDGTVIEMHMTRGEVIEDAAHAIVVADLSRVWADFAVYQKDLPFIHKGQKAVVSAGPALAVQEGTISYISPVVDEDTRTAVARVILPNADGRWRPGLFVNARVLTDKVTVPVAVPKTALERFEDRTVVFVKTADGFVPRPVELGLTNQTFVEVKHGLNAGQTYVSRNGFTLKAELQKESFGGGHGE